MEQQQPVFLNEMTLDELFKEISARCPTALLLVEENIKDEGLTYFQKGAIPACVGLAHMATIVMTLGPQEEDESESLGG